MHQLSPAHAQLIQLAAGPIDGFFTRTDRTGSATPGLTASDHLLQLRIELRRSEMRPYLSGEVNITADPLFLRGPGRR